MMPNRIIHMYGDKPPLYSISMYALFFGIGWLCAKCGEMGFANIFFRALGLFVIIHFIDAFIKSVVWVKNNFNLILTLK